MYWSGISFPVELDRIGATSWWMVPVRMSGEAAVSSGSSDKLQPSFIAVQRRDDDGENEGKNENRVME